MPVCPECRVEYAEGITQCADCHVPLVDQRRPEDGDASERGGPDEFVTVFEGGDSIDYRMAKGLLESNGFHLKLIGGHDASYPPLAAQIQVRADEAEAAQELLNSTSFPDDFTTD